MRDRLKEMLATSMKAGDKCRLGTVRLILAAIKDRDIANRTSGKDDIISDYDILTLLQKMVKQRRESTKMYQDGGRMELAAKEEEEIAIIEEFLPQQIGAAEIEAAVAAVVAETGAAGLKDMGGVMALLKKRFTGRMDFAQAAAQVKNLLGG